MKHNEAKETKKETYYRLSAASDKLGINSPIWNCVCAGKENADCTVAEKDVVEGSEEYWDLAIESIAESARGNCVEHLVFPWLRKHGVAV